MPNENVVSFYTEQVSFILGNITCSPYRRSQNMILNRCGCEFVITKALFTSGADYLAYT